MARKSVLFVALALLAVGCGGGDKGGGNENAASGGADKKPIIVGAIFDQSGPTADVGTPYSQGIQDFVKFTNDKGGIDGHKLDLRFSDFGYKVPNAEQLYSQYVSEGAVVFMGWGTADTEALRTRVTSDEIPFMSASYAETLSNPQETPYNFFPGVSYSNQLRAVLKYISETEKGAQTKVAVFHHDSPFGTSPLEDGQKYITENKLKIEMVAVKMPTGAQDFNPQLQNEGKGAKYIVIQNVPSPSAKLVQNIRAAGTTATIVCMNWCGDEIFLKGAGKAAEGTVAVMPFAPATAGAEGLGDLVTFTGSEANLEAKTLRYVQGWFTMATMSEGIAKALKAADGGDITGPDVKAALETVKDFSTGGVSKPISFSESNHAGLQSTPLYVVKGETLADGTWKGHFEKLMDEIDI
jgi:branched-chain amino acid transport system substrate-binding protein